MKRPCNSQLVSPKGRHFPYSPSQTKLQFSWETSEEAKRDGFELPNKAIASLLLDVDLVGRVIRTEDIMAE